MMLAGTLTTDESYVGKAGQKRQVKVTSGVVFEVA